MIVKVTNLNVYIDKNEIIHDISFQMTEGQIVGLIGPNGAGKTTIMKTILGLTHFSGNVQIEAESISETNHKALKKVGALIEHPAIYPFMSGYQNLKLYSRNPDDLQEVISLLEMTPYIYKKSKDYSLGMKQKLGIAMSLLDKPKLVILDEPMNGLDIESTILIRNIIQKYAQKGTSFLISSHILSELQKIMTHVLLISDGHLIIDKPMEDFYHVSSKTFKLLTDDKQKTMDLLTNGHVYFLQSDNFFILNQEDINKVQDLLYTHHIRLRELTPVKETFEDIVIKLLKAEERKNK